MAGKTRIWKMFFDLVFMILLFVAVAESQSAIIGVGAVMFADAGPVPPMKCTTDYNCSKGTFCRTSTGLCSFCADCLKQHRRQGASECAKSSPECGPCTDGYKDVGGHCTDTEDVTPSGNSIPSNGIQHPQEFPEDHESPKTLVFWWLLGIFTVLGTTLFVCIVVVAYGKAKTSRHRRLSGSGEKGLGEDEQIENTTQAPSAPLLPEEYNSPPPYASSGKAINYSGKSMHQFVDPSILELMEGHQWHLPHHSQPRVVNNLVAASPFNAGNGAGEWAQAAQNVDAGNDNADGGAAPQPEPQPDNEVAAVVDANPFVNLVQEEDLVHDLQNNNNDIEMEDLGPLGELNYEIAEEDGNLEEVQDGIEENYEQVYPDPEDLHFELGFLYRFQLQNTLPIQGHDAGRDRSQSATSFYVDDTVLDLSTLTNLTNSHASSSISMAQSFGDSGTGTSNEDDQPPTSPLQVPNLADPDESSNLDADNDDSGLYDDNEPYEVLPYEVLEDILDAMED